MNLSRSSENLEILLGLNMHKMIKMIISSSPPASPSTTSKPIFIPSSFSSLHTSTSIAMPLMNSFDDDDIFYSDDESSGDEMIAQTNSYFPQKPGLSTIGSINKIVKPVDQISSGMKNLYNECRPSPSYSAITRRSPISNAIHSPKPVPPRPKSKSPSPLTSYAPSMPYRFISKNPVADPRYPADQQLMLGPIPGHLNHDNIYNSLRGFFQTRGPVQFMFIHKGAVKIPSSGDKSVKFGYVVFAKKGPAQSILKEGTVTFGGHSIKVRAMDK